MPKSPDAFRTISEVADWLGIQAHVLRFWESKFSHVKPVKRAGGRRYYRPADMLLLGGIKKLLHDDGLTIKGVQKMLREKGVGDISDLSQSLDETSEPTLSIEVEAEDISATVLQFHGKSGESQKTGDSVEPATDPAPEIRAEDAESDDSDADDDANDHIDPLPETAALPGFLSRQTESPDAGAPVKPAPLAPQPDVARAKIVDAPDPGPDDSQSYTPGALGQLAGLEYLTAQQAKNMAPLAAELRAWLDRATATHPA